MLTQIFWLSLFLASFSYFIYPLSLLCFNYFRPCRSWQRDKHYRPRVSIIIAAYNEEAHIQKKIHNTLALSYPRDKLEIIIASDCSSDNTDARVKDFASQGVTLVRSETRLGKENAQRCAISHASGDILVFSDVATHLNSEALITLVSYFADSRIGALSSEDRFLGHDGRMVGEGAYVKYEMWLRQLESCSAGLVGLSGSFFAARAALCQNLDIHTTSDFYLALQCKKQGYRAISAPDVLGYYSDIKDPKQEYVRKKRTIIHGLSGLINYAHLLNPLRYGGFAYQLFSHKLMRWAVPWLLIATFVSNAMCWHLGGIYVLLFIAQCAAYLITIAAHYHPALQRNTLIRLAYFFMQANWAIFDGCCQYLAGQRMRIWEPSKR